MYIILFTIIGLCMGSFYLVYATRLPEGGSILRPSSHCDNCNHKLKWYELIPIISYIFLKGKCSKCHKKVSIINLIVELVTGIAFGLGFYLYGFSYEFFAFIIIASLTIIIFISDFKYMVILDSSLIISSILILILKWIYFGVSAFLYALLGGIVLIIFMLLVKIIGDRVYKRESLGWGDVKLSFFIGATLGIKLGFVVFIIGSMLALPYAFYYISKKKEKEIPYGPFLIIAVFIIFVFMKYFIDFIDFIFLVD